MWKQIHDNEIDTSHAVALALLVEVDLAPDRALSYVDTSGTSNAMWRFQSRDQDLVLRLPRTPSAAASIHFESELLAKLAHTALAELVQLPQVTHAAPEATAFTHPWAIFRWIEGTDVWSGRAKIADHQNELAVNLATAITSTAAITTVDAPQRAPGSRGGPLLALLNELENWLSDPKWAADDLLDVAAIRRCAAQSAEVADEPVPTRFLHGDLIPGNLLVSDQRLSAIIDWGGAGFGDPAQDVSPAWAVFDSEARQLFRDALEVDEPTWLRARAFELEHAVGAITYYEPRGNALAAVMRRTLDRILSESGPKPL